MRFTDRLFITVMVLASTAFAVYVALFEHDYNTIAIVFIGQAILSAILFKDG